MVPVFHRPFEARITPAELKRRAEVQVANGIDACKKSHLGIAKNHFLNAAGDYRRAAAGVLGYRKSEALERIAMDVEAWGMEIAARINLDGERRNLHQRRVADLNT